MQALEQGETEPAKAIFAKVLKTKEDNIRKTKEAAAAARHLNALAFLSGTKAGLTAQQEDEQIKVLTEAITALSKANVPARRINAALHALEQGDTTPAQAIFAEVLKTKEDEVQKAEKEAAATARHLGALASLNNTEEAVEAYRKAVKFDPDNAEGWSMLGHLLSITDFEQAKQAYHKVLSLAKTNQDRELQDAVYDSLSNLYQAHGKTDNTPPTAVIESSATAGTVPLNVSFTGSGSHDTKGSIIAYLWNFGDGSPTASGSTTSHQYTVEGTYNTSLKVTDNQGATDTVSTSIIVTGPQPENQVPTAKITTSTTQGSVPLTVTFDGSASTDPENGSLTYSWNFGDGAFDQGEVVHHTYNMPGSVTATLTVTDSMGAVDNTSTTIKVLPGFSFEVGEVEIDNNWVRVEITENFVNPIVVTGSPSSNDSQPCVIRLRNIDKTGFEIRLQEWDYLDGKHSSETVAYLILEQGRFTLKNGTLVEAGQFDSQNNNFHSVSFAAAFATEPIIMTSIASFNEGDAVTGRIKNISLKSFEHKIQEQESFSNGHSNETVNYVAWEVF